MFLIPYEFSVAPREELTFASGLQPEREEVTDRNRSCGRSSVQNAQLNVRRENVLSWQMLNLGRISPERFGRGPVKRRWRVLMPNRKIRPRIVLYSCGFVNYSFIGRGKRNCGFVHGQRRIRSGKTQVVGQDFGVPVTNVKRVWLAKKTDARVGSEPF